MILLIESHKHYSLISNSGAAAGGWELPAAATEAVLEGIGPGGGEAGRAGRVFKGMNLTMGVYSPHPTAAHYFMGMPQFGKKITARSYSKGILGQAPHKGLSLPFIFLYLASSKTSFLSSLPFLRLQCVSRAFYMLPSPTSLQALQQPCSILAGPDNHLVGLLAATFGPAVLPPNGSLHDSKMYT